MKHESLTDYGASTANAPKIVQAFPEQFPARSPLAALGGVRKRVLDIFLIVCFMPLTVPLILALMVLVKASDGGAVFFAHRRVGFGGKQFNCWKFRTMVENGDRILADYLARNPQERLLWETQRKLKDDPRITPLGAIMRKLSLDELPQLWNILRGEMSIVGPRPVVMDELALYGNCVRHYLRTRPGLTGLWQVSGRSFTTYRYRVLLDRTYVTRWSVPLDLWIIARTIPAVVASRGAV